MRCAIPPLTNRSTLNANVMVVNDSKINHFELPIVKGRFDGQALAQREAPLLVGTEMIVLIFQDDGVGTIIELRWLVEGQPCEILSIEQTTLHPEEIRCPLTLPPNATQVSVHAAGTFNTGTLQGDAVVITGTASGEGVLNVGFSDDDDASFINHPFAWADGVCPPIDVLSPFTIFGEVSPFDPDETYGFTICEASYPLETPTFTQLISGDGERCLVTAYRVDGAIRAQSIPEEIAITPGDEIAVRFDLPEETFGGMGFSFRPVEEGVEVLGVRDGSPAEQAGLASGDVVVAVDGEPIEGIETTDFISMGPGPVGSKVTLTVLVEEAAEDITFERVFID